LEQLEVLYESTPKPLNFIERKVSIPSKHVNIYGPPKSGKTWLLLDYLSNIPKKKHLYLDLNDVRLDKSTLNSNLQNFYLI
jgi:predicted AAA+ superfamily ATPase